MSKLTPFQIDKAADILIEYNLPHLIEYLDDEEFVCPYIVGHILYNATVANPCQELDWILSCYNQKTINFTYK